MQRQVAICNALQTYSDFCVPVIYQCNVEQQAMSIGLISQGHKCEGTKIKAVLIIHQMNRKM